MDMKERKIKEEVLYSWDMMELGMKLEDVELENKLNRLQNTIDAIGFFSLTNMLILLTYIVTKGF